MKAVAGPELMPLRPIIGWTLVVCIAVAMAPWLSGGQEPLALLLSTGAVLLGGLIAWRQPVVRRLAPGPLMWAYGAFVAWGGLSLWWSANRYSTMVWLIMFVLAGVIFRLAYIAVGEEHGRQRLVQAYLASAAVFALYGVWLYFTSDYDRFTSTFYWANPAAAYLIPAILVSLDGLRSPGRARWYWLALTAFFGAAFVLADSRAATLVLLLVTVLYLLVQKLKKRDWITLLFGVLSVIILSNASVQLRQIINPGAQTTAPGSRFAEAASGESKSGSDRLQYLVSAGSMWFEHPAGGVGAGTYGDVHPRYQGGVVSAATSAHNFYVQTLAELGIVGVMLLAWMLLALLLGSLRGLIRRPRGGIPIALGLLAILLHSGLDIDARYPAIVLLAAVLAGVLYAQGREVRARASWSLPALATLLLIPVIGLYQSATWAHLASVSQSDNDYALAADQYGQAHSAILYNPDVLNAEGINLYSQALGAGGGERKGLADLALERARRAQSEDPADAQHKQLEGRVQQLQGDMAGAEQSFKEAMRRDPYNHPEYALDLANLQANQGRLDEALATANAMLAQYPDEVIANRSNDQMLRPALANLWALAGNIYLTRGDITGAGRSVGRALTIYPKSLRGRALKYQVDLQRSR